MPNALGSSCGSQNYWYCKQSDSLLDLCQFLGCGIANREITFLRDILVPVRLPEVSLVLWLVAPSPQFFCCLFFCLPVMLSAWCDVCHIGNWKQHPVCQASQCLMCYCTSTALLHKSFPSGVRQLFQKTRLSRGLGAGAFFHLDNMSPIQANREMGQFCSCIHCWHAYILNKCLVLFILIYLI